MSDLLTTDRRTFMRGDATGASLVAAALLTIGLCMQPAMTPDL